MAVQRPKASSRLLAERACDRDGDARMDADQPNTPVGQLKRPAEDLEPILRRNRREAAAARTGA